MNEEKLMGWMEKAAIWIWFLIMLGVCSVVVGSVLPVSDEFLRVVAVLNKLILPGLSVLLGVGIAGSIVTCVLSLIVRWLLDNEPEKKKRKPD